MKIKKYTLQELKNAKGILLYGAGAWGKLVLETLQTDVLNGGDRSIDVPILFIDRMKTGTGIIKKEEIRNYPDYDILICAPSAYDEIVNELYVLNDGNMDHVYEISEILKSPKPKTFVNVHDRLCGELLLEKYDYYKNRSNTVNDSESMVLPFLGISVTERCSLNCEKCIALMPYYQKPNNFCFMHNLPALERLVKSVDKILEVGFLGGEVFMHNGFAEFLEWAINQEKIKSITVLTNSTIIPNKKEIELLKNDKVIFGIDDYGNLSLKMEELIEIAKAEQIKYYVLSNEDWQDLGDTTRNNYSEEKRNKIFNNCSFKDCHLFLNGKLYRCQRQAHLTNLGFCESIQDDYVDYTIEKGADEFREDLKKLLQERKYALAACDFCKDITMHINRIPAAEQRIPFVEKGED